MHFVISGTDKTLEVETMKKMLFVFNPNSGKGQIRNHLLNIIKTFSEAGFEITIYPTKATNDGYEHIKKSEGRYDLVVCSGGDGTLNETVAAIMEYQGEKPQIGYIPSGTTNDFATSLSIPKNMRIAAEHIAKGRPKKCDIGIFNGRSFNYVAAFGAFTDVSYETPQQMKNILGHQAYIIEAVKRLSTLKSYNLKIICDGEVIEDEFIYGMISNAKSVGGIKGLVGKDVKLNDGLFELTFIKQPKNPLEFQQILGGFLTQTMEDKSMIYARKVSKARIESENQVPWTLDGEFGGEHTFINFEVAKEAVEFIVKKRSEI